MLNGRFGTVNGVLPTREQPIVAAQAPIPDRSRLRCGADGRYDLAPVPTGADPDEPMSSDTQSETAPEPAAREDERLAPLRGAGVSVDARRVGAVVVALLLAGLAVLVVVLFVAGARKNAQITELRDHGEPVEMTVTGCIGLLGGSGSNPAGYSCHGTFAVGGRTYDDPIPGNALYGPGQKLAGVTVARDPALFTTPGLLQTEHPSWRVYLTPVILTLVLVLAIGGLEALRRRRRP